MAPLLPPERMLSVNERFPCRTLQIRQLSYLLSPSLPSPSTLIVHGLPSTGKTSITRAVLDTQSIPHVYINCAECITARHLFEQIIAAVLDVVRAEGNNDASAGIQKLGRCETVAALAIQLHTLLEGRNRRKFVLILDGIDGQREATPTLLPGIARLGEIVRVPSLTIVLIFCAPSPRPLLVHISGVPHVSFPPYTQKQVLVIMISTPPAQTPLSSERIDSSMIQNFYPPFVSALLASLVLPTTSLALPNIRTASAKLWPQFIAPVLSGELPAGSSSITDWDFPRLLVRNRSLFQSESVLSDRIVAQPEESVKSPSSSMTTLATHPRVTKPKSHGPLLPYLPTVTLLAALLASSTPPKQDVTLFSALSNGPKKSIRRRRKTSSAISTPSRTNPNRVTKSSLSSFSSNPNGIQSLPLRPITLERLTAILRTIISPSDLSSATATSTRNETANAQSPVSDILNATIPTLSRLRLLIPATAAGSADPLGGTGEVKWRTNVSKDFVRVCVREWGLEGDLWRLWEDVGVL